MEEESNCRICSEILHEKVWIRKVYKRKYDLIELIEEIASLEIKLNEHYPQSICLQCAEKLVEFHIFRRMILDSEDRFQLTEELKSSQQIQNVYSENLNRPTIFLSRTTDYQIDLVTQNEKLGEASGIQETPESSNLLQSHKFSNEILPFDHSNDMVSDDFSTVTSENQSCMNLESIDPTLTFDSHEELQMVTNEQSTGRNNVSTNFVESFTEMCKSILDATHGNDIAKSHAAQPKIQNNETMNLASIRQSYVMLKDIIKSHSSKSTKSIRKKARNPNIAGSTSNDIRLFQCEMCNRIFNNKYNFLSHFRYAHMAQFERRKCPHCPRSFKCPTKEKDPVNLRRHIRNVHKVQLLSAIPNNMQAKIKCSNCMETFQTTVDMYIHSKVHDSENLETVDGQNLFCNQCKIDLKTVSEFINHMMTVHNATNEKEIRLFQCRWCGVRCKTILGVYSHVRGAHRYYERSSVISSEELSNMSLDKPKEYLCGACGNVLRTKTSYNQHMAIHANDKPFTCNVCSAKFITNASLRRHYAIHSGEKRFKCDQCGKSFRQTAHLKTHRKQHGIGFIEAFTCKICNKEFMQKGSLKTHMWSHTKDSDKPYKCNYCNTNFLWKYQMENHFRMSNCI